MIENIERIELPDPSSMLKQSILGCDKCQLRAGCNSPVLWDGPEQADIMFFGEAPGANEDRPPYLPFQGQAGAELNGYLFRAVLEREDVHISNVIRCRPPNNKLPTSKKELDSIIGACLPWTLAEIQMVKPKLIIAMGATAIRTLIGNVTVEEAHGKLHEGGPFGIPVFATMHPAAGLHNTRDMRIIQQDFDILKDLVAGRERQRPVDEFPDPVYRALTSSEAVQLAADMDQAINEARLAGETFTFSADTEWTSDGKIWCMSLCMEPGEAYVIWPEDIHLFADAFANSRVTLHSAQADLNPLRSAGIPIDGRNIGDTMVAAYLLGLPQALKDLCRSECGMEMVEYGDVVGPYQRQLEIDFFNEILEKVPEPEKAKGDRRLSLHQKIKRAFTDLEKDPKCNWRGRWVSWDEEQKRPVMEITGKDFPTADLSHVPIETAIWYSARDADGTERARRKLEDKLKSWSSFKK